MSRPPLSIILLGDPAAGKATHGARLARARGMVNLDMGAELRTMTKNRSLQGRLARGELAPTDLVRRIFETAIKKAPAGRGILFNGTPKMIGEAKLVRKLLEKHGRTDVLVIYLHIPLKEILIRMKRRRRAEDNPVSLKERERYYQAQVSKVVAYFKTHYPYRRISSLGTKTQTHARITKDLRKFLHEQKLR